MSIYLLSPCYTSEVEFSGKPLPAQGEGKRGSQRHCRLSFLSLFYRIGCGLAECESLHLRGGAVQRAIMIRSPPGSHLLRL
jgi:hypothetical protein